VGEHEVLLKSGGAELHREVVAVAGGDKVTVKVEGGPASAPAGGAGAGPAPADDTSPDRLWTWVAFGVGGAGVVGAVITGSMSMSRDSDRRDKCPDGQCPASLSGDADAVETLALATDVLIGVAAVGVAAGVALYFLEPDLVGNGEVSVAPTAWNDGAGLTLGGRF